MKRHLDKLDLIAGFAVAAIIGITAIIARHFLDAVHTVMLCVGIGVQFFGLAALVVWLIRQG